MSSTRQCVIYVQHPIVSYKDASAVLSPQGHTGKPCACKQLKNDVHAYSILIQRGSSDTTLI